MVWGRGRDSGVGDALTDSSGPDAFADPTDMPANNAPVANTTKLTDSAVVRMARGWRATNPPIPRCGSEPSGAAARASVDAAPAVFLAGFASRIARRLRGGSGWVMGS